MTRNKNDDLFVLFPFFYYYYYYYYKYYCHCCFVKFNIFIVISEKLFYFCVVAPRMANPRGRRGGGEGRGLKNEEINGPGF